MTLATSSEYTLIVGLGNPGLKYAANRHNVGFHCVRSLASAHDLTFHKKQKRARIAMGTVLGRRVIIAKPQTFMNESGRAVAALVRFYKVRLERVLVVYDDLDLPLGAVRLRPEGGTGGHKGMRSIVDHLGSQSFPRLRIGIDRPPGRMDPAAYVLQDFSMKEKPLLEETLGRAVAAIETWLGEGVEPAMSQYNRSVEV
ncbi:MAG TPA: aminoacyl-tRNA hydrolase [Thermoflexia bacterium]|nr:aminoacyl-tRNA hydrolase [Thermoflexia bacterium]